MLYSLGYHQHNGLAPGAQPGGPRPATAGGLRPAAGGGLKPAVAGGLRPTSGSTDALQLFTFDSHDFLIKGHLLLNQIIWYLVNITKLQAG